MPSSSQFGDVRADAGRYYNGEATAQVQEMNVLDAARTYVAAGLSVVPVRADGTKALALRAGARKQYEQRLATDDELRRFFGGGRSGLAVLCGPVSGNLEAIDFDKPGALAEFEEIAADHGASELVQRLVHVRSPRDPSCGHLYYRCPEGVGRHSVPAYYIDTDDKGKRKGKIEVRGEGFYCVVPGGPPSIHETGRPWELLRGDLCSPPEITAEERAQLLLFARMCEEAPEMEPDDKPQKKSAAQADPGAGISPLDDFRERGRDYLETKLLPAHGWTHTRGNLWRRPGKEKGHSASLLDHCFCNFSTNSDPFTTGPEGFMPYSFSDVYRMLEHNGDARAAARALRDLGYGSPAVRSNGKKKPAGPAQSELEKTDHCASGGWAPILSEWANAKRLVAQHGKDIRYDHVRRCWFIWDGRRWAEDLLGEIERRAKSTVRSIYAEAASIEDQDRREKVVKHAVASERRSAIANMIDLATSEPGIPVLAVDLDRDPWLLNCRNGTVDLRTGELRPHRREDMITKLCPVDYDPAATHPLWDDLLQRVTGGDVEILTYLQKAAGYSLSGSTREDSVFVLVSDGGGGKTSFLEPLAKAMGDYASTAEESTFMAKHTGSAGHSEDIAALAGARFVIAPEIGTGRIAEERLKRASGGDTMRASRKHGRSFEFTPAFTLWMAANKVPNVDLTDSGVTRRWRAIPWIPIPKSERDPAVKETLKNPSIAGPAVLAWAVLGCQMWLAEGLGSPLAIEQEGERQRRVNDNLSRFLGECCIKGEDLWTPSGQLKEAYERWCREGSERPVTPAAWGEGLREYGATSANYTPRGRHWRGIGLIETSTEHNSTTLKDGRSPQTLSDISHEGSIGRTPVVTRCPVVSPAQDDDYEPGADDDAEVF